MKNTIKLTIPFSFKGKEFKPFSIIDLDGFVEGNQDVEFLFHHVATENKIDSYSYEYEVLASSPLIFSEATGLATHFLSGDNFDFNAYKHQSKHIKVDTLIQEIALQTLDIKDLNSEPEIKKALQAAFKAGIENFSKKDMSRN